MPQVPDVPLEGLYGAVILDHYRNPRHHGTLSDPDLMAEAVNPFCGDEVYLQLKLDTPGRVSQVGVHGQGCSISQASASMMAEMMEGKAMQELATLSQAFQDMMRGRPRVEDEEAGLGDLAALQVVRQFPVRIKCALLAWSALDDGIQAFYSKSRARS